jgi:hypothetical protein
VLDEATVDIIVLVGYMMNNPDDFTPPFRSVGTTHPGNGNHCSGGGATLVFPCLIEISEGNSN